ncbi:hypothetical protein ASE14_13500 [Agromyces sp. Root81]|uniref:hypothetical protein n=1 Tax=Agromyces sp. Root81 TaxID=1736601 RepID=UPI000700A240|nr:hypothetical protein [Agromyces sp. Root81]KRC61818.1 hypothetical protein ASE14_13500 [Agromyces sp. Root81]
MLVIASVLMLVLAIGHSLLGERFILVPLSRQHELPRVAGADFPLATLRFAWHVTSVLALAIAIALALFAFDASVDAAIAAIGWCLIAASLLPLVFSRARHPSWLVLAAAGVLCVAWAMLD